MLRGITKFIFLWVLLSGSSAFCAPTCESLFTESAAYPSGHNVGLQKVMQKMVEYEQDMQGFARSIRNTNERTIENLAAAQELVEKYQALFAHVIEHAQSKLMTPRIDTIEGAKKAQYAVQYQQLFVEYAKYIDGFALELKRLSQLPPDQWTSENLESILREMNNAQPKAHAHS
jgi:hypothetical protein